MQVENEEVKRHLNGGLECASEQSDEQNALDGEDKDENELDVTIEEEEENSELWEAWEGELCLSQAKSQSTDEQRKRRASRRQTLPLDSKSSQVGGS